MTLHIICERDVGLFSLIQQVVAQIPWAKQSGRIPIVVFGDRCCYWVPEGRADSSTVWEYYFEPVELGHPAASIPRETRRALAERFPDYRTVGLWLDRGTWASSHFGDHPRLKGKTLSIPYGWRDPDLAIRERAATVIQQYVRPRKTLLAKMSTFFTDHMAGRTVIGVQIRGTDAISNREDRAHRKDSLNLETFRQEVARCITSAPDASIFVATDDQHSLDFMVDAFGERVIAYDTHRHEGGEAAGSGPTGCLMPAYVARDRVRAAQNGEDAVIEYLLLSECAILIHNGSSLARTVLLKNATLPHLNTHRKNRLLAEAQTLSLSKLRRIVKRGLRHANLLDRRASTDA